MQDSLEELENYVYKPKALGGMGFKDLEKFNETMLAKQVRRLLVDQFSLFYWVFSAKYSQMGQSLMLR